MIQEKRTTRIETSDALTRFSDLQRSVYPLDLAFEFDRVATEFRSVKVFAVHIDSVDLMIVISGVVVDALCRVAAGGVDRDLELSFGDLTAAALLVDGAEDVEELAHAGALVIRRKRAELREGDLHETGLT